jgi:hypothetical protein
MSADDDSKFDSPWRRDGPLPELDQRDGSRRRYEGLPSDRSQPGLSDTGEWRSSRPRSNAADPDVPSSRRRGSGFSTPEGGAAGKEEVWVIGSKFKPSSTEENASKFGTLRGVNAPKDPVSPDDGDWRSGRPRSARDNSSRAPNPSMYRYQAHTFAATASMPPTPQLARRKLELLPRSGSTSASPSPLSSPKLAPTTSIVTSRPNPFGSARYVPVVSY